jgi:AraC-like DNA-binding protein
MQVSWTDNEYSSLIRTGDKKDNPGYNDFISLKIKKYKGFSLSQWESRFSEDVKLSANNSDPLMYLHFLISGKASYKANNSKELIAQSGQYNLWNFSDGNYGHSKFKKDEYYSSFGIYLRKEYIERLVEDYPEFAENLYLHFLHGGSYPIYNDYKKTEQNQVQIIHHLLKADMLGKAAPVYCEAKILELLSLQTPNIPKVRQESTEIKTIDDKEKIYEARRVLISNLDQPLSLRNLAKVVGINEQKLKSGFKEIFGYPTFRYLTKYKMELAMQYLRDTQLSINQVALKLGYEHQSHFCRTFRIWHGITPRKARGNSRCS